MVHFSKRGRSKGTQRNMATTYGLVKTTQPTYQEIFKIFNQCHDNGGALTTATYREKWCNVTVNLDVVDNWNPERRWIFDESSGDGCNSVLYQDHSKN